MPSLLRQPVPNREAAAFIKDKPVVSRQVFDGLLPEIKARAFVITGIEDANVVQAVRDRIAEIPQGADWDEVKADIAGKISPFLNAEGDEAGAASASRRAELLLRGHGFQAYAAAQYEVMDRQRAAFPFWQYLTSQDDRVRDSHAALDGLVLPADSPFWATHFPPWDYGCRCQVVPLQAEDVADIEKADADKKPEEQRVLSPERQAQLEKSGVVIRALDGEVPRPINVTPRADAPRFEPGTLKLDVAQLRERYDAETFANFEKWAKATPLAAADGPTVFDWLAGRAAGAAEPGTPRRRQPSVARVAPAAPVAPPVEAEPVRKAPVSAALEVRVAGSHQAQVRAAIAAVDKVHDDGALPVTPMIGRLAPGDVALGRYTADPDGRPIQIAVRNDSRHWPALTTAHEIGHLLDHQVLGKAGEYASATSPVFKDFRSAVLASASAKDIAALPPHIRADFFTFREFWARAYAQYIAAKSGDPLLRAQLVKIRTGSQGWRQWSDEDFAPISTAIDELFRAKGWIK